MLRTTLLSLSESERAKSVVSNWGISRKVASRFVAGDSVHDAAITTSQLREKGFFVTLDHLGENVSSAEQANEAVRSYLDILHIVNSPTPRATLSIKLTQLGLTISDELCRSNLQKLATEAAKMDTFLRIDMEDSSVTEKTISLYRSLHDEGIGGIGLVLQSYLYRSCDDLVELLRIKTPIRLVKGAYSEPPSHAYPRKEDVDAQFDRLVNLHLENIANSPRTIQQSSPTQPPLLCVATHDDERIRFALDRMRAYGISPGMVEFQMLYGIARGLQRNLLDEGHPVRIYVPFGTQWYPYLTRRLAERPANLRFFVSHLFERG